MAIYNTLRKGSQGDEVRKLQNSLVSAGYDVGSTGVDGIYGPATEKAVLGYQRDKGLQADGIAGEETLGSLYSLPGEEETPANDPGAEEAYRQALRELEETLAARPEYENTYESRLEELYNAIVGREPFTYDSRRDPAYSRYRDQYLRQGQLAMENAIGKAAGLTGGYGNSYAQTLGQEAYQGYLELLRDLEGDLYSQARSRYDAQGQALSDRYAMLEELSQTEYDRWQDALAQYRSDLAQSRYRANDAYNRWQDARQLDAREKEYELAVRKYLSSK